MKKGGLVLGGVFGKWSAGFIDASDDLVLYVGDVHHVIDLVTAELQHASHEVSKNKRSEISDVCEVMHRGATAIHAQRTIRIQRFKRLHITGKRVV